MDEEGGHAQPLLHYWFHDPKVTVYHLIDYNNCLELRNQPLQVIRSTQSTFSMGGPNRAVMSLGSRHQWCGTIVVLKYADLLCQNYVDIEIGDLDDIKNHFVNLA